MTESPLLVALAIAVLLVGVVAVMLVAVALARLAALGQARGTIEPKIDGLGRDLAVIRAQGEDLERDLKQDMQGARTELKQDFAIAREEQAQAAMRLRNEVSELAQRNDAKLEAIRLNVEKRLDTLRSENADKLEQMRATVDEKLQATLEARLGASFKQVSDRLEQVHRGLGEMQTLATGVGDLKRVLTNVKSRGTWGEVQLARLIEDNMTPEQYAANIKPVPGSDAVVEFAIRLPGRGDGAAPVWLPIDAKFPKEEYERLMDAQEAADAEGVKAAGAALGKAVEVQARLIAGKYVAPPHTTDFAIMFLPTESLYAEVLRRPGLLDRLHDLRINVAGPSNLAALLNSLQMGFRTLAIEQRSSEVWQVLRAVKTEFGKFGDALAGVKKTLDTASSKIGQTEVRTRAMLRNLKSVEALPEAEALRLLGGEGAVADDGADDAATDDAPAAPGSGA
jgi:DNA recombination protein RmuC